MIYDFYELFGRGIIAVRTGRFHEALDLLFLDPSKMLKDDVQVHDRTYKLVLLPVWVARWTLNEKPYRAFINGQTGKISGRKDA